MQKRINVFGDLIETSDLADMSSSLMSPGRLTGMSFEVAASDLLKVKSGSCLLPDGVLIMEDSDKDLVIPSSSYSSEYTIIYQLEDSRVLGASPALLKTVSGIMRQSSYTDATVLGWIKYPGGSIPLADKYLIQPDRLRVEPTTAMLADTWSCPFLDIIRPPIEVRGNTLLRNLALTDITQNQNQYVAFGERCRIVSCSLVLNSTIAADTFSYLTISLKKGTDTLFSWDTRGTNQGAITLGTPSYLIKNSSLSYGTFIIENTEVPVFSVVKTGSILGPISGQLNIVVETPASSGRWSESVIETNGEKLSKFLNLDALPQLYTMQIPFVISGKGSPKKVVSRLSVDFNCMVTFRVKIAGNTITLDPSNGLVSNTGGVLTREFNIPNEYSSLWIAGNTALIEVEINAQAGRSASFAHVGLSAESSPFLLFI